MREIGFRGKRKDNRKWVYGYYIETDEREHYIFTGETGLSQVTPAHVLMYKDFVRYEVISETVGEYTGHIDSGKNKLFEGDIFEDHEEGILYLVVWDDYFFSWEANSVDGISPGMSLGEFSSNKITVRGNEWDNPELLGRG